MEWLLLSVLGATGYNFTFWACVSFLRWVGEIVPTVYRKLAAQSSTLPGPLTIQPTITPSDVAIIMAAHDEEISLPATLAALKKIVPTENIYVGSDASTDATVAIARAAGVQVVALTPNRGKAKTLVYLLETHRITERYKAVMLLDADVIADERVLERALPYFNNPKIAAVACHAVSHWQEHWLPRWSMLFTAYRIRLWRVLQYTVRYGQTWHYVNLSTIVPGGSSIYRSVVLAQLTIDTPGLIIEDFNMTFDVHHKKLGKITYHPHAYVIDQEPYSLRDYCRQIYRWHLGWWQTVIHHGIWPSVFWVSTFAYELELVFYSFFVLSVPLLLILYVFNGFAPLTFNVVNVLNFSMTTVSVSFTQFFFGVFAIDYLITAVVALIEKKPVLSLYGLGFFLLRLVDVVIFLWTLPVALFKRSEGRWISPARRL